MNLMLLALSLTAHAQDPAADAPPAVSSNVDFSVTLTAADGTAKSGHVKRVERGEDIYGDKGWLDDEKSLSFYVENEKANEYKKITWDTVKKVSIKVVNAKDISCLYSSEYTPWMYECSVKLTASLSTKDGKSYVADSGHKWRFFFDDGSESEFWLKRHYARAQDDKQVELGDDTENRELYEQLQGQLKGEIKGAMTTSIAVK